MNDLLAIWRAEHANFARLLSLLDEQVQCFHLGERPDYGLIGDIVGYLKEYGDAVHHPREDYAFARLMHRDQSMRMAVNRRLQEHRVIDAAGRALLELLAQIDAEAIMSRHALEAAAATYLIYYRHHLAKEESEILPRIERVFDESDWAETVASLRAAGDPLSDPKQATRFASLRSRLAS